MFTALNINCTSSASCILVIGSFLLLEKHTDIYKYIYVLLLRLPQHARVISNKLQSLMSEFESIDHIMVNKHLVNLH